jgi:ATP/maltotriose-dependent transcriptional regulator MalT
VKSHAMSIYRKLGVSSRGEAIQRARDLGLLAD